MRLKRVIIWTAGAVSVLLLGLLLAGLMLLHHSPHFRASILRRVEQSVSESTGAHLVVRDFSVTIHRLELDLYGIVVHGTEPSSQKPLLTADHVRIAATIDSWIRRKWHLRELTADHAVAAIMVDQAGKNNLPKPRQQRAGQANLFEFAVDQAAIHEGELYYNDQKMPLDAAVENLEFRAVFDHDQRRYLGDLRYRNGKIQYQVYTPVVHDLDAEFGLTPNTFTVHRAVITTGDSRVIANAVIEDYASNPQVRGQYEASVATRDIRRILRNPAIPAGDLRLTGSLQYQKQGNLPLLSALSINGTIQSNGLVVATPAAHGTVRNLDARYTLEHGDASLNDIQADILGGVLKAQLMVRDVAGRQKGRLQATLRGVDLAQLRGGLRSDPFERSGLRGTVEADAVALWVGSFKTLTARGSARLQATLGDQHLPVNGAIHADYLGTTGEVALHRSFFQTPSTSLSLDGKISNNSQLQIRMRSEDLHELELLVTSVMASPAGPHRLDLHGRASLRAAVSGSLDDPQIVGSLEAMDLRARGSSWKTVRGDIRATPSLLKLENCHAEPATQGNITFNFQAALTRWSYLPSNSVNLDLTANHLSVDDLEKALGRNVPVTGTLNGEVALHGSQLNPAGSGKVVLVNATAFSEPVHNINLSFQGDGTSLHANLVVRLAAGVAQGNATLDPRKRSFQFELHADDIHLEAVQALKARKMQIAGALSLDASGRGTMESPELEAKVTSAQLQIQNQTIRNLQLQTTVRNYMAKLVFSSETGLAVIQGGGTIGIKSPYDADLRLDSAGVGLQSLVALYSPRQAANVSGHTEFHATLRGPLAEKKRVEGHLEIPALVAGYNQFQIESDKPIRADCKDSVCVLQPVTLKGTGTSIDMQATIPIDNMSLATVALKGSLDLHAAELLVPDMKSSGQVRFEIESQGKGLGSQMAGQIRVVDASMHPPDAPVGVDHLNGVVNVSPTRLDIVSLQGQMNGGTVTARGGMTLRPAIQFDLGMEADNSRLRYPEGIRALLTTKLALSGTPQASTLTGQVQIQRISFTPDFDLGTFTSQFSGETATPAGASSTIAQGMRLNVNLQSTSQVNLESSQVSISGAANLRVAGTAAEPVILGRADLTGGELFFGGNRYVVQNGTIDFLNPVRTEPVLNLQVQTKISDYNITLGFRGPLERLHTTYTSDPALPPADIINLITRGQTTEAAAAQPSQPLSLGAQSLVASTVSGQIGNRIAKVAGISQLQIDPSLGVSNGQDPGARIAVQQRVTGSLFVTFSTDVTSTTRQAVELEYQLSPRWFVTGVRDQNGGISGQVHYKKRF